MDLADVLKLQALPVREKLLMVEVLWQSMGDANNELEVSEGEKRELALAERLWKRTTFSQEWIEEKPAMRSAANVSQ